MGFSIPGMQTIKIKIFADTEEMYLFKRRSRDMPIKSYKKMFLRAK